MPRQARIDAPGALHHIVIREIERRGIFKDDKDREDFLERLSGLIQETATPCYDPEPASKSNKSTLEQRPRVTALCERKKRAQEALSYKALVQSWPEILRLGTSSAGKLRV
jgi:hypothetical protein